MHEYMYVCMYACIYCMRIYVSDLEFWT